MVTIKDIAKVTGVSATTVSNVIHGRANRVSAETVEKINSAIKTLGYVPNMSARTLVSNSSKVIGYINHTIPKKTQNIIDDPFHSIFTNILEQKLREHGYYLMYRTVETSEELLTFLRTWNVDGLFFTGVFKDTFFEALSSIQIPVVLIDSYTEQLNVFNVGLEDYNGCYTSTKYLIDRGHRNIAFASPSIKESGVVKERFDGYCQALCDASIPFDKALVLESEMDYDSCKAVSDKLCKLSHVTALVTTADIMAANIMVHLKAGGKSIPDDISIVGFDDIALSRLITPPLTTIHQDIPLKGSLAVDMMLQKLEGNPPRHSQIILSTKLIERESVRSI
ncbi:MAG: LacI family DNA-binding transcriptional regulator [Lachnospiraceae bacterium]|nr:LacI family DNA-binding transcriptional regulator [Lachnospiraceae bacterium]